MTRTPPFLAVAASGRAGLNADITASSASPNSLYGYYATNTAGLPGYMLDMDVQTGSEDISFRQLDTPVDVLAQIPTGRLMGTTTGFTQLAPTGPDGVYSFAANRTYTGSFAITRLSGTEMQLTGTIGTATHTITDTFDSADTGMLAFWSNSNLFGSSNIPNTLDNGIDFSNIRVEFIPAIPEPGTVALLVLGTALVMGAVRRRQPMY